MAHTKVCVGSVWYSLILLLVDLNQELFPIVTLPLGNYRVNDIEYIAWWHFILRSDSEKSNLSSLQGPVAQRMTNHSM